MPLDEDDLQTIELRAEAIEAMACLAKLDTLNLIAELRRMRAIANEFRTLAGENASLRRIAGYSKLSTTPG